MAYANRLSSRFLCLFCSVLPSPFSRKAWMVLLKTLSRSMCTINYTHSYHREQASEKFISSPGVADSRAQGHRNRVAGEPARHRQKPDLALKKVELFLMKRAPCSKRDKEKDNGGDLSRQRVQPGKKRAEQERILKRFPSLRAFLKKAVSVF